MKLSLKSNFTPRVVLGHRKQLIKGRNFFLGNFTCQLHVRRQTNHLYDFDGNVITKINTHFFNKLKLKTKVTERYFQKSKRHNLKILLSSYKA